MWCIATRNRPELMQRMMQSMHDASSMPVVSVMQDACEYSIVWPTWWHVYKSEEHLEMSGALNAIFKKHPNEAFYGMLDDHTHPVSQFWAADMEDACGPWDIVSNYNTVNRNKNGRLRLNNYCMGGELARALGWIWPNFVVHLYGDDVIEDIGYELGILKHLPNVLFKTHLLRDGTLKPDENSKRIFNGKNYVWGDEYAYQQWKAKRFSKTIEMLRPLIDAHRSKVGAVAVEKQNA